MYLKPHSGRDVTRKILSFSLALNSSSKPGPPSRFILIGNPEKSALIRQVLPVNG
jgi:hypothetical protein